MDDAKLDTLRSELQSELTGNILPYWINYVKDEVNGGYVGSITYNNQKVYDAPKGGILAARLTWTFSACYKQLETPELKDAAKRAYDYFKTYFVDNQEGGIYWMVDADGKPLDDRKHVYAQAFGIYSLVEYYSAFKDRGALNLAFELYQLIEKYAIDSENGGYFEAYNRYWEPNDDVRLSEKDENEPKSMNTHLHLLEAYANLYRYTPNEEIKGKLSSLIDIFCDYIINKEGTSLINFMGVDWTPKSDIISYGHNIETSWLLYEAAEILGDTFKLDRVIPLSISLATAVLENGIDTDGGLLNEADSAGIIDSDKDWWPQAEAVVGFLNAYELSGNEVFLNASVNSWEFIKNHIIDKEYGEWYEKVSREGIPYKTMDKVRSWKCPYHNSRTVLEVLHRFEKRQQQNRDLILKKKLN